MKILHDEFDRTVQNVDRFAYKRIGVEMVNALLWSEENTLVTSFLIRHLGKN